MEVDTILPYSPSQASCCAEKLTLGDLAEPEIISDDVVLLITNSFIINKYGVAPLQVKHLKKVKVKQSVGKD
jgi:hypothetical protein